MPRYYPPGHDAMPVDQWPILHREAWAIALQAGNPFEETGQAARLRPRTHASLVSTYGRWLTFLEGQGVGLADTTPSDCTSPERARAYVVFLRERGCASVTLSTYLGQLHAMLRHLAPGDDWQWLCDIQARMHRLATPSRRKVDRLVPAAQLFALGCELMQRAVDQPPLATLAESSPHDPALLFRDGFAIAFLALRPLRLTNFLNLEIGRHLCRVADGRTIIIPPTETKNHSPIEIPFPDILVPALELYLVRYRPKLISMAGPYDPAHARREPGNILWIARTGMPMTAGALTKALDRHMLPRFGHRLNPHGFRNCVATSLADEDPENIRMAARLLGHNSFSTTERSYILALGKVATRHHQDRILKMRAGYKPPPIPRTKVVA